MQGFVHAMMAPVLGAAVLVSASAEAQQPIAFVECPVFRNVHEMRGCWIARYRKDWYYLGSPGGVNDSGSLPPQLKHKALIEGTITEAPRICGGIVIKPVRISPLAELSPECNTVLPAEGYAIPAFAPTRGIPNPDNLTPPPTGPYQSRKMPVNFYFDTTFFSIPSLVQVQAVAAYVLAAKPRMVIVHGARGSTVLSDGHRMIEQPAIAEQRAQKVLDSLVDLGVDKAILTARWDPDIKEGDGLTAPAMRSVQVEIVM